MATEIFSKNEKVWITYPNKAPMEGTVNCDSGDSMIYCKFGFSPDYPVLRRFVSKQK